MLNSDSNIAVYNRVKADLEKARSTMTDDAFMSYWEKRNDELRDLVGGVGRLCVSAIVQDVIYYKNSFLPEWRNGRRSGLKIRRGVSLVRVRVPSPAPLFCGRMA